MRCLSSFVLLVTVLIESLPLLAEAGKDAIHRRPLLKPKIESNIMLAAPEKAQKEFEQWQMKAQRRDNQDGTTDIVFSWLISSDENDQLVARVPVALDAVVHGCAKREVGSNVFSYAYELSNLPSSIQDLYCFVVEAPGDLTSIAYPDEGWEECFRIKNSYFAPAMPGILWIDTEKYPRRGIKPGKSAKPFGFQSAQPPGIVRCFVQGYAPLGEGSKTEAPPDIGDMYTQVGKLALFGKTIGPRIMSPQTSAYLADLISMTQECLAEGWIVSASEREVLQDLKAAQDLEKKGDLTDAHSALAGLLKKIEKMKEQGFVLDEAYAILRFNLEVLEGKLKQD